MQQLGRPDPSDPAQAAGIERRVHERHAVRCPAICSAGTATCAAIVVDASNGGFGLEGFRLALDVDEFLMIELEQIGVFRCRVAWKRGERCGVEIVDDGSPASFEIEALAQGISQRNPAKAP